MVRSKSLMVREEELKGLETLLKHKFKGIDYVIDKVINDIRVWFISPDLLKRPTIINLWGMTGVGKTDLVKTIVSYMKLYDQFFQIDFSTGEVPYVIMNNRKDDRYVYLFDEFQFLSQMGESSKRSTRPTNLWQFLSDGVLQSHHETVNTFERMLNNYEEEKNSRSVVTSSSDHQKLSSQRGSASLSRWEVNEIQQSVNLTPEHIDYLTNLQSINSIESYLLMKNQIEKRYDVQSLFKYSDAPLIPDDLLSKILREKREYIKINAGTVSGGDMLEKAARLGHIDNMNRIAKAKNLVLQDPYKNMHIFLTSLNPEVRYHLIRHILSHMRNMPSDEIRNKVYNKTLVFISANLDNVFPDPSKYSNDIDGTVADKLHEETSKIALTDVKKGLIEILRPEQAARLGNNHIIYRSLTSESFMEIIDREVKVRISSMIKEHGIDIKALNNKTIKEYLYKNGVWPTQGVRPLYSTIESFFLSVIPKIVLEEEELISINDLKPSLVKSSVEIEKCEGKGVELRLGLNLIVRPMSADDVVKKYIEFNI